MKKEALGSDDPQSLDNRRLSVIARNPNHPMHTHAKAELDRRKMKNEGAMKRIATTQSNKADRVASGGKRGLETFKKKETQNETKGAPKGYHFTRSGKLRKGDAGADGPGGAKLRSDPLDKQRSKIPPLPEKVAEGLDETSLYDRIKQARANPSPDKPVRGRGSKNLNPKIRDPRKALDKEDDRVQATIKKRLKNESVEEGLNEDKRSELYHSHMSFHHAMKQAEYKKKNPELAKKHDQAGSLHAKVADMHADNHPDASKHGTKANKMSKALDESVQRDRDAKEGLYASNQTKRLMSPLQKVRMDKEKADRDRDGKLMNVKTKTKTEATMKSFSEISRSKLGSYAEATDDDYNKTLGPTKNSDEGIAALKKKHGMSHTKAVATMKRLMGEGKVDEISMGKMQAYGKAAAKDIDQKRNKVKAALDQPASVKHAKAGMKAMQGLTKRSRGSDMYVNKMTGRSKVKPTAEETVNELDKKTLGSYIKKAGPDAVKQTAQAKRHSDAGDMADKDRDMYKHYAKSQRAMDKAKNRQKGIGKAVDKLTKEDTMMRVAKVSEADRENIMKISKMLDREKK